MHSSGTFHGARPARTLVLKEMSGPASHCEQPRFLAGVQFRLTVLLYSISGERREQSQLGGAVVNNSGVTLYWTPLCPDMHA